MSASLTEEPLMGHEEMALRLTHQTSQAAYYKLDNCYSPLDIRSRFAGSSPHTLVSSSSSSSHRNSPDEAGSQGSCHELLEDSGPPQTIAVASLLYHSDSPASSLRSEDELVTHLSEVVRVKRRKQNKPVRYETDQEPGESQEPTPLRAASPTLSARLMFAMGRTDGMEREEGRREDGERMDGVSTSISSPGSISPGGGAHRHAGHLGLRVFPTGPNGVQIFNTDAYCELCDREFCNKYFLKTHKANKHGVYDPTLSTADPSTTMLLNEDDDGMRSPRDALDSQKESPLPEGHSPFGMSFLSPNPFFIPQSILNAESPNGVKREKKEMSDMPSQSQHIQPEKDEEVQLILRQRLLQMYAQNLALQQMYRNANSPQGPSIFPGMMPMSGMHAMQPPLNLLNFFGAPQHHQMPLPSWPHEVSHHSPPPFPNPPLTTTETPTRSKTNSYSEDINVCDICQRKLSSQTFLRIHRRKKHGILDEDLKEVQTDNSEFNFPLANAHTTQNPEDNSQVLDMSRLPVNTEVVVQKKKRRPKKKKLVLERQLMEMNLAGGRRENEEIERPSSTTDESFGFPTSTMMDHRPFVNMAISVGQPAQFSNLQRLLQDSLRDPRTGRRETFRCSECLMEFAARCFLESHYLKHHHHHRLQNPSTSLYDPTPEATVLDLSTAKSRNRRSGENLPPHHAKTHSSRKRPVSSSPRHDNRIAEDLSATMLSGEEGVVVSSVGTHGGGGLDLECYCMKCNREYCSKYFLRTHLKKEHQMTTEQYLEEVRLAHPEVWQQFVAPPGGMDGVTSVDVLTGSGGSRRNWCRYCKKDFCNKYFFKTHMQKMHNEVISPVTGQRTSKKRSTGVPCEICNKLLCSKYFLKIHKRNTHGIIDPTLDTSITDSPSFIPSMSHPPFPSDNFNEMNSQMDMDRENAEVGDIAPTEGMFVDEEEDGEVITRPTVITCTGTHFIPSPSPVANSQGGEENGILEDTQQNSVSSSRCGSMERERSVEENSEGSSSAIDSQWVNAASECPDS